MDEIIMSEEKEAINVLKNNKKMSKQRLLLTISLVTFFLGHWIIYIGLAKGHDIAINLSRPMNSYTWSTSSEFIEAWTYFPILFGGSIVVFSVISILMVINSWLNKV